MTDEAPECALCGAPARLHCAGCNRVFCVEHLERKFAMGYFYFCAECLARQAAQSAVSPKKKRGRPGAP